MYPGTYAYCTHRDTYPLETGINFPLISGVFRYNITCLENEGYAMAGVGAYACDVANAPPETGFSEWVWWVFEQQLFRFFKGGVYLGILMSLPMGMDTKNQYMQILLPEKC